MDVVFHCAASVAFDPPIDQAFQTNLFGTTRLYEAIERATRAVIVESLEQNGGNRTRTAKDLGISARWLITNIRRYKIDAADTDDDTNDDAEDDDDDAL